MNKKYYNYRTGDTGHTKQDFTDKSGMFVPAGTFITILNFVEKSSLHHFSKTDVNSANEEFIKFIRGQQENGIQIDVLMSNFSKIRKPRTVRLADEA